MSADRLAEMAAEIERLRAEMAQLKGLMLQSSQIWQTENSRLLARIAEMESHAAISMGTLQQPTPDEPATITHNIPPSAPPHDEPQQHIGHTIKWPPHDER